MIDYQYNHKMWVNLVKCASVELPTWVTELDDAKPWFSPTVVRINEVFLVNASLTDDDSEVLRRREFDGRYSRSRLESLENHVHMISLLGRNSVEPLVLLKAGLAVGDGMIAACAPWPEEPFLFSISYDEAECTVRFWKQREGEELMTRNLELFQADSVLTAHVLRGNDGESPIVSQSLASIPRWVRRHLNQRQILTGSAER